MFYTFIGFTVFSIFLIVRNHRNSSAIWFAMVLIGFCISILGLTFYSVYIWDYSYVLRKLFFNLNKNIWLFIYYLKLDSGMVMRLVHTGAAIFSYSAFGMAFNLIDRNRKIRMYLVMAVLPVLMIIIYDPHVLNWFYRVYKESDTDVAFKTFLSYINMINGIWIKIYIAASIAMLIYAYKSYTNMAYRKKLFYMFLGVSPIYILYVMLFYWVPQPFIVLRDFDVMKNTNPWEVSEYLTLNFKYGKFTYITVIFLSFISVSLLLFAIVKYNLFDKDIERDRLIFSNTFRTANQGARVFSHSIKNQLVAIRMTGEEIYRNMDENDKNKDGIENIIGICNETIIKLNALRDMSNPYRSDYIPFNVFDAIREITQTRKMPSDGEVISIEDENDFLVLADRQLFKEAVKNIIDNSIEAFDPKRSGILKVFFEKEGKWGIINIRDNGIGISEEDISRIFTPFFTTKPTITNWGIGLSFSKNIIETFKGEIQVTSKPDWGTLFRIYMPLYKEVHDGKQNKMHSRRRLHAIK